LENALDRDLYKALVIGGGVSASCYLRARFEELAQKHGLPLFIPPIEHCTDNGAMVAYVGNRHYINNDYSQLDLAVEPALNLFSPRGA